MTKNLINILTTSNHGLDDYDPNSMPVAKAKLHIRNYLNPVTEIESINLHSSLGRILATDILSPANVPNYDNSAMDGYAFNADDISTHTPTTLKIIGTAFAGKAFAGDLSKGECVRIMTGGALPGHADTVVMQERVSCEGNNIHFVDVPKRGSNVRYAGEDLAAGKTVITSGHLMHAADLGLIASLGIDKIKVYRKLKVAFFSTGDELASVGQLLKIGQVYDSNRYTLHGMLTRMGVEIIDMGPIPDNPELLERTLLASAKMADVVISSGGVSVGEADYMKMLLEKHGQVVFWKIAMKPGRPLAYGKIESAHYFGLPGNPVAVMVTFYQLVREAILVLMGQPQPEQLPLFSVECTEDIRKMSGRTEFQRGLLFADTDGIWKVKPTGAQGSAILSSMSRANCFIVLDENVSNLNAGTKVQVQVLDGII